MCNFAGSIEKRMSRVQERFVIRYSGLPEGVHTFDYNVGHDFFAEYHSETDIQASDLNIHIEADRNQAALLLKIKIKGNLTFECDRCLDPCIISIESLNSLIFTSENEQYGPANEDTIIRISEETASIVLDSYLYDFIMLSIPLRRVHDELDDETSNCNQDMLQRIKQMNNHTSADPRWEKLKEINLDN